MTHERQVAQVHGDQQKHPKDDRLMMHHAGGGKAVEVFGEAAG